MGIVTIHRRRRSTTRRRSSTTRHQPGELDQDVSGQQLRRQAGRPAAGRSATPGREGGPDGTHIYTWHLAMAMRPKLWVFNLGRQPRPRRRRERRQAGRITVQYHFTQPGQGITLFTRTMTIPRRLGISPLPDGLFRVVNPANIDKYHAAVASELEAVPIGG